MSSRKFKVSLITVFCVVMSLMIVNISFAAEETYSFKVSTPYPPPEQSLATTYLVEWQEMVKERTNGDIKFKNYYGGTLGDASEHLELVSRGSVDMVVSYGWYTPTELPLQDYDYAVPFSPDDPYIITKTMRRIYEEVPEVQQELKDNNIARVFQAPGLRQVFLSKEPVDPNNIEDFEGRKCKVIGKYFGRWIDALGMSPVSAPGTEVYTMLQTGVVDIALDPLDLQYSHKNIEQAPNVIDPGLMVTNWVSTWVNLDSLEQLPEEYQEIILRSGEELELKAALEIGAKYEDEILKEWKEKHDVEIIKLSDEVREEWAERMPNTALEWAQEMEEKGLPGMEILELYIEYSSMYGHEWVINWLEEK